MNATVDYSKLTKEELANLIGDAQKELEARRAQEREKLISDFLNAYKALGEARIDLRYSMAYSDYEEGDSEIYLARSDNFEFDY